MLSASHWLCLDGDVQGATGRQADRSDCCNITCFAVVILVVVLTSPVTAASPFITCYCRTTYCCCYIVCCCGNVYHLLLLPYHRSFPVVIAVLPIDDVTVLPGVSMSPVVTVSWVAAVIPATSYPLML